MVVGKVCKKKKGDTICINFRVGKTCNLVSMSHL